MWGFELSLTVILGMIALSQVITVKSKGALSLQFVLGVLCLLGFGSGFLSPEVATQSKMIEVGIIAYSVLLIHGGTLVDLRAFKPNHHLLWLCGIGILTATVVLSTLGVFLFGKQAMILSVGPVIGGGATAAIVSNGAQNLKLQYAVLPWLVFMLQGFAGVPIFAVALKCAAQEMTQTTMADTGSLAIRHSSREVKTMFSSRLPTACKGSAYYLFILMAAALFNKLIHQYLFGGLELHSGFTALLIGIAMGHIGLIERDPLSKADALGILMLGLMTLMIATLAHTPIALVFSLLIPVSAALCLSAFVLTVVGYLGGKLLWRAPFKGICVTISCMVGLPAAPLMVRALARKHCTNETQVARFEETFLPMVSWTGVVIVNGLSVLLGALALKVL